MYIVGDALNMAKLQNTLHSTDSLRRSICFFEQSVFSVLHSHTVPTLGFPSMLIHVFGGSDHSNYLLPDK